MLQDMKSTKGMKDTKGMSGFSLMEMLVVLVLMAMLAALVGPRLFQKVDSSKVTATQTQIELLTSMLDTYRLDVGRYPSTEQGLSALRTEPEGVRNWDGPYLSKNIPLDPWGFAYQYKMPGQDADFALYSLGRDGAAGGEDEDADVGVF